MPLPTRIIAAFSPFHPQHFPYMRFLLTLVLGVAGASVFVWANVPLPWMLGPMCICTLAVLMNAPVAAPAAIRPAMISMVGVMLGSNISPELLAQIPRWSASIAIMMVFLLVAGVIGVAYYRIVGGLDRPTAFYSGMPGGLIEMVITGEKMGGDGQMIALIHSTRVLLIVSVVPFIVQFLESVQLGPRQASSLSITDAPFSAFVWIIAVALAGAFLGSRLRLPAGHLFGPLLLSGIVHSTGLTDFVLPKEIVSFAQLMIGCATGCRFLGFEKRKILRVIGLCLGATTLIFIVMLGFIALATIILGTRFAPLLLAFAPAGIAEMSLIGIALHLEVAYVLVHQILRIMVTSFAATIVFRLIRWHSVEPAESQDKKP